MRRFLNWICRRWNKSSAHLILDIVPKADIDGFATTPRSSKRMTAVPIYFALDRVWNLAVMDADCVIWQIFFTSLRTPEQVVDWAVKNMNGVIR